MEEYFRSTRPFWKDIYEQNGIDGTLYRLRRDRVNAIVDSLGLPTGSQALEIGCGMGLISVGLARRGYHVNAVDIEMGMIESVRRLATEAKVSNRLIGQVGDVHHLDFRDNTFDMVIAIGVLEWVPSLAQPLSEMTRVLKPGGHLIVNVDNAWALHCLLDPLKSGVSAPAKRLARRMLEKMGAIRVAAHPGRCSIRRLDAAIAAAGLRKIHGTTCGFGPFSFLSRTVLPDRLGVRVHNFLQRRADRGIPVLRSAGEVYLVLARK